MRDESVTRPATPLLESEIVEAQLLRKILSLELTPGSCVTHAHLCSVLGCGRMPLREAIQRLSGEGLLVSLPKKGVAIAPLNLSDLAALREAQSAVEFFGVRVTAERILDAEMDRLEQVLTDTETAYAARDLEALAELDLLFHSIMAEATRNPYLTRSIIRLERHAVRFGSVVRIRDAGAASTCEEHRRILTALRQRDADAAEHELRNHISRSNARILGSLALVDSPDHRQIGHGS